MGSDKPSASSNAITDEELVKRARNGEREAFGALYERHLDAIFRYLSYRLGTVEDAEDLTTNVFLRAWQNIDSYTWRGLPFLAWLYRIAHNLVIDFHRTNKTQWVDLETQWDLPDDALVPERQLTHDLQVRDVMTAMDELDTLHQEVLTLRFLVGLSHREVAAILDKTEAAARVLQYRALKALRIKLE